LASEECEIGGRPGKAAASSDGFAGTAKTGLAVNLLGNLLLALQAGFGKANLPAEVDAYPARPLKCPLGLGLCLFAKASTQPRDVSAAILKALDALGVAKAAFLGLL
jgi:hypothetical protein